MATPDAYFDDRWTSDDPWEQADRWSEVRKFDLTAAVLPRPRYQRAFEPGCGTGLLTERLAPRVDALVAMDRHPRAVAVTRRRCAGFDHVEVREGRLPGDWPDGRFDLVVLSEVLYYLDPDDLDAALDGTADVLGPGGDLVVVHFRPTVEAHALTGDEVHGRCAAHRAWRPLVAHVEDGFVLEAHRRR